MKINKGNELQFAEKFIERYSSRGFGSMNKNEFEVLIFNLLRQYGDLKDKSNYDISILLQIPENKVKRLAYEADLRYVDYNEQKIRESFFNLIVKAQFKADNKRILFVVEDKFIRSAINSKLKELGHFADSSFNREIVTVHLDAFIDLIDGYYPPKAIERIIKECKDIVKKEDEEITFKSILKQFIHGAAKKAGGIVTSSVFAAISGGATSFVELKDPIHQALEDE